MLKCAYFFFSCCWVNLLYPAHFSGKPLRPIVGVKLLEYVNHFKYILYRVVDIDQWMYRVMGKCERSKFEIY